MNYIDKDHSLIFIPNGSGTGIDLVIPRSDTRFNHYSAMNPVPYMAPETPIRPVSRFQAKAALLGAGLLQGVEDYVSQSDDITKLAWSECVEWRRDSPLVKGIGSALGLSDKQIDELFVAASSIVA